MKERILELADAIRAGKEIEFCRYDGVWVDCPGHYDDRIEQYRVKPPPKEIWVNEYPNLFVAYESLRSAQLEGGPGIIRRAVLYREVIE